LDEIDRLNKTISDGRALEEQTDRVLAEYQEASLEHEELREAYLSLKDERDRLESQLEEYESDSFFHDFEQAQQALILLDDTRDAAREAHALLLRAQEEYRMEVPQSVLEALTRLLG